MNGFCCWLLQLLIEALAGMFIEWAFDRLRKGKTPRKPGKHFKGV